MASTSQPAVLGKLDTFLNDYLYKKAPVLPNSVKDILVQFAPYLAILGIIFSIPGILAIFGAGAFLSRVPMAGVYTATAGFSMLIAAVGLIINTILMVLAVQGLFARTAQAWQYLWYASVVNVIISLLQVNILGAIIGGVISFYVLYQVKSYYK